MRNFKKFLALVLAMLMVSACAVSVSAAYSDQADINATGYEKAVAALGDLGVMKGSGDGTFNPNGTLTRAEAAVIAAKLVAGAKGLEESYWNLTDKPNFDDVTPDLAWSYPYINKVVASGIMVGVGDGKFDPNGTLQVDQALTIAIRVLSQRIADEIDTTTKKENPTYWAMYWTSKAEDLGLIPGDVASYRVPCSRATMAQISYNVLSADLGKDSNNNPIPNKIKEGFGLETLEGKITSVTDSNVVVSYKVDKVTKDETIPAKAFSDALEAAEIKATAAELKNCMVTITYSSISGQIYGVSANAPVVYTYADAKIEKIKDNKSEIKVDGITYKVGVADSTKVSIGSSTVTNGLAITVDDVAVVADTVDKMTIPTYYKAFAYDDDGNGDFERLDIKTYVIGTLKVDKVNNKGVTIYSVDSTPINPGDDADKPVIFTGVTFDVDGKTPVVLSKEADRKLNDAGNAYVVDIIEVADTKTGVLVGIGKNYINLGGENYTNTSVATAPSADYRNQEITVYLIGGQYYKVAEAASKTSSEIVIDSVVVKDDKVVISGYDKATFAKVDPITVEGIKKDDKFVSAVGYQNVNDTDPNNKFNTTVSIGFVKDGKFDTTTATELKEGAIVKLIKTSTGVYIDTISEGSFEATLAPNSVAKVDKLEVKNGYVYVNGKAAYYTASDVVIIQKVVDAKAKDNTYAQVTYNKLATFPETENVTYSYNTNKDGQYTFIYITKTVPVAKPETLAAGQSIVFIPVDNFVESTYDKSIFNAVDLFTGEKILITASSVTAGKYYVIDENKAVVTSVEANNWINDTYKVTVSYNEDIPTTKAKPVELKDKKYDQTGKEVEFGLDNIIIYNAGILDKDEANTFADAKVSKADIVKALLNKENLPDGANSFTVNATGSKVKGDVYVAADKLIIVLAAPATPAK